MNVNVTEMGFAFTPTVVTGESARARITGRYVADRVTVRPNLTGGIADFVFEGFLIHHTGTRSQHRRRFHSTDPKLNEVKLTARRVASTASTRALTGAR